MPFMTNLNDLRKGLYAEFINQNKFVSKLTESQKNDINAHIKEYNVKSNEILWQKEDANSNYCFFIYSGEFNLYGNEKSPGHILHKGQLVGDFPN
jgi:signal-transduction protein with cAMP-binding, CBS, and nucleotidyltransferase domain